LNLLSYFCDEQAPPKPPFLDLSRADSFLVGMAALVGGFFVSLLVAISHPHDFYGIPFSTVFELLGGYLILSEASSRANFQNLLGSGTTVLKLQVAIDADWDQGNIMEALIEIATRYGKITTRSVLASLLADVSLALLRRKQSWNSVAFEVDVLNAYSTTRVETAFQRMALKELSILDIQSLPSNVMKSNLDAVRGALRGNDKTVSTQAMVSLVVALRGSNKLKSKFFRSETGLEDCLLTLAAEASTSEGEDVLAVEVLWTPCKPGTVISQSEILEDYPQLIPIS